MDACSSTLHTLCGFSALQQRHFSHLHPPTLLWHLLGVQSTATAPKMEIDDSEVLRRVAARRSTTGVASAQAQKSAKVPRAAPSFNGDDSTSAGPITERNANTMVGNNGSAPSLRGDPEALKVRTFPSLLHDGSLTCSSRRHVIFFSRQVNQRCIHVLHEPP